MYIKNGQSFFDSKEVSKHTGLTVRQLQSWEKKKIFVAEEHDRGNKKRRLYSIRDIVLLKTFVRLSESVGYTKIKQALLNLQELFKEADYKKILSLRLVGFNGEVFFINGKDIINANRTGQGILGFLFQEIINETKKVLNLPKSEESSAIRVMKKRWA